jgi:hypothetical protein
VLCIAGGPELILHPETARDLMLAQGQAKRSRSAQELDEVTVPVQLQWRGLEQGTALRGGTARFLGDVLLSAVHLITGLVKDPATDFVASKVAGRVDGQVETGVYSLKPETLSKLKGSGALLTRAPENRASWSWKSGRSAAEPRLCPPLYQPVAGPGRLHGGCFSKDGQLD